MMGTLNKRNSKHNIIHRCTNNYNDNEHVIFLKTCVFLCETNVPLKQKQQGVDK
jgi:hypothetical protein